MNIKDFIGPYQIVDCLGSGGMADLYLAEKISASGTHQSVVIKRIQKKLLLETESSKLFCHEAELHSRMKHSNIVALIDFISDDQSFYTVLEYVNGPNLYEFIEHIQYVDKLTRIEIALPIADDLLEGLAYSHELKDEAGYPLYLVHRDVSPSNILITIEGHAKLCDFGLAKSKLALVLTAKGFTRGKIRYMSPEQAEGTLIDHRSDLFSAGLCLHEILAGTPLLDAELDDLNAKALRSGSYLRKLSQYWSDQPAIHVLLQRALQPEPAKRFQSAKEFQSAVRETLAYYRGTYKSAIRTKPKRWSRCVSLIILISLTPLTWLFYLLSARLTFRSKA